MDELSLLPLQPYSQNRLLEAPATGDTQARGVKPSNYHNAAINHKKLKNMETEKIILAELQTIKQYAQLGAKRALTMDDVSLLTGLSKSRLYKLCYLKQIPYRKNNGRYTYFDKAEVEDWMLKHRVKTNDEIESEAAAYIVTGKTAKSGKGVSV